jgi:hypothetical protein
MTIKELKEKYLKDKRSNNKGLIKLGILKIDGFKQHSFNNEYWVEMSFNYWNPFTYLYIIMSFLIYSPGIIYEHGIKELFQMAKEELRDGFGEWIK